MHISTKTATRIEGNIPPDVSIADGEKFLFISRDQRAYTHGLHKYPAKFFPELPRFLIERYTKVGDTVLDPFMGSGTANLEASILARNSIGVDVDPFSRFIAKVKTTPLPIKPLHRAYEAIRKDAVEYHPSRVVNGVPDFPYRDNWFKPHVLKELAYLKMSIEALDASRAIKNFFLVCFSSVIRASSEADNNCTRTVIRKSLNKNVPEKYAIDLFIKRIDLQVENMKLLAKLKPQGKITIPHNADARSMPLIKDNTIDLAVTSPPYLNAVDYPRTHQLELYWLGFESGTLQPLKSKHVGTEVVKSKDYVELHKTGCESADKVIERIFQIDKRRAFIASKYISDMLANMREVYRVIKPGGRYVLVIGNNLVRGIDFETWRYLKNDAHMLGYKVESYFVSAIINHFIKVPRKQRINDDYILVLRK